MSERMKSRPLDGQVAVVTGASRGGGRGIALELGAAGARVYVTGRSTAQQGASGYEQILALSKLARLPGTIDETVQQINDQGGVGIAVPCDHTRVEDVEALFQRVIGESGKVDLLVNNAWGGHESFDGKFSTPFWEQPLSHWDAMIDRGVRNHWLASRCAAPLMVKQKRGLIVTTTFWDRDRYLAGNLMYDLAKASMNRLARGMAEELREHGVASVAVSPGWMRTEFVLAAHAATESTWRDKPELAKTESPRYLGRAVVALAADPGVRSKSGETLRVGDLAREYGFTDVDGRQVAPFEID